MTVALGEGVIGTWQRATLALAILLVAVMSLGHVMPSFVNQLNESLFSQQIAMRHITAIAARPHPAGSAANAAVRAYLLEQIRQLGFTPELQTAVVLDPARSLVGKINNVLVKVPGSSSGKALLLMAHYDSVHTGPGAADDGASVAAMLESMRLMKLQSRYQNSVIFLFTDAEEPGLLGAKGFIDQHPWAQEIGLALNFEYRGNSGAFMMFETSPGNGMLVDGLKRAVPAIFANSLTDEVYKFLPNDTDLSVFKRAGVPAMNFAAIGGLSSYHTQLDRPAFLDRDTLQQQGEMMASLLAYFGNRSLDNLAAADAVFFDLPGCGLIDYPVRWVLPLALGAGLLILTLATRARLRGQVRIRRVIAGGLFFLVGTLAVAGLSQLVWMLLCVLHPEYRSFVFGHPYNSQWYMLAFASFTCALIMLWRNFQRRWLIANEQVLGTLLCWWGLLVWVSVKLPGASFLLQWPVLSMLLALLINQFFSRASHLQTLSLFLGAMPGLLLFLPVLNGLYDGLGMSKIGIVAFVWVWFLGLAAPLLEWVDQRRSLTKAVFIVGIFSFFAASATAGFNSRHPKQNSLSYRMDAVRGSAWWLSDDLQLDAFTARFFPNETVKRKPSGVLGERFSPVWLSPAPVSALIRPSIDVTEHTLTNATKLLKLRVASRQAASALRFSVRGAFVLSAKINGQLYSDSPQEDWTMVCLGWADQPVLIELELKNAQSPIFQVNEILDQLPEFTPKRPAEMMDKPMALTGGLNGGSTIVYYWLITNLVKGNLS